MNWPERNKLKVDLAGGKKGKSVLKIMSSELHIYSSAGKEVA